MHRTMRTHLPLVMILALLLLAACGGTESPAAAPPAAAPTSAPAEEESAPADPPAPSVPGMTRYTVVTEESSAAYIVQEELFAGALQKYGLAIGNAIVRGVTPQVSGYLDLDVSTPQNGLGGGQIDVDITLLQTDQELRDGWIQENGPRLGSFPVATFVPTAIEGAPASYTEGAEVSFQLLGDLTVRAITRPITFAVTATFSGGTLRGTALADAKLTDFGIDPPNFAGTLTVADEFQIEVSLAATATP